MGSFLLGFFGLEGTVINIARIVSLLFHLKFKILKKNCFEIIFFFEFFMLLLKNKNFNREIEK
jgi:hypothetical protein